MAEHSYQHEQAAQCQYRLHRNFNWKSRHFYPDVVDCIDVDDDLEKSGNLGKFFRWASGRRRYSERRKKYPRWTSFVRQVLDGRVTTTHEHDTPTIPEVAEKDQKQIIGGIGNGEKQVPFTRQRFLSSSVSEKRGAGKFTQKNGAFTSSPYQSIRRKAPPIRRISDPCVNVVTKSEVVSGNSTAFLRSGSKTFDRFRQSRKLDVVEESGTSAVKTPTNAEEQLNKPQSPRQITDRVTTSPTTSPSTVQDSTNRAPTTTTTTTKFQKLLPKQLRWTKINERAKTRRELVRQKCRRLIGWDPYSGGASFQAVQAESGSPAVEKIAVKAKSNVLTEAGSCAKSPVPVAAVETGPVNESELNDAKELLVETDVGGTGSEFGSKNENNVTETIRSPEKCDVAQPRESPPEVTRNCTLPNIVIDHYFYKPPQETRRTSSLHEKNEIPEVCETVASGEKTEVVQSRVDTNGSYRIEQVPMMSQSEEPNRLPTTADSQTSDKQTDIENTSNKSATKEQCVDDVVVAEVTSSNSAAAGQQIVDDYDYVLYRINSSLRQQLQDRQQLATPTNGLNYAPEVRRSVDHVIRKGQRALEKRQRSAVSITGNDVTESPADSNHLIVTGKHQKTSRLSTTKDIVRTAEEGAQNLTTRHVEKQKICIERSGFEKDTKVSNLTFSRNSDEQNRSVLFENASSVKKEAVADETAAAILSLRASLGRQRPRVTAAGENLVPLPDARHFTTPHSVQRQSSSGTDAMKPKESQANHCDVNAAKVTSSERHHPLTVFSLVGIPSSQPSTVADSFSSSNSDKKSSDFPSLGNIETEVDNAFACDSDVYVSPIDGRRQPIVAWPNVEMQLERDSLRRKWHVNERTVGNNIYYNNNNDDDDSREVRKLRPTSLQLQQPIQLWHHNHHQMQPYQQQRQQQRPVVSQAARRPQNFQPFLKPPTDGALVRSSSLTMGGPRLNRRSPHDSVRSVDGAVDYQNYRKSRAQSMMLPRSEYRQEYELVENHVASMELFDSTSAASDEVNSNWRQAPRMKPKLKPSMSDSCINGGMKTWSPMPAELSTKRPYTSERRLGPVSDVKKLVTMSKVKFVVTTVDRDGQLPPRGKERHRTPNDDGGQSQELSVADLCVRLVSEVETKARDLCRAGRRADIHVVVKPVDNVRQAVLVRTESITSSQSLYRQNGSEGGGSCPSVNDRQTASPSLPRRVRFQMNDERCGSLSEGRPLGSSEAVETGESGSPIDSLWNYIGHLGDNNDDQRSPEEDRKWQTKPSAATIPQSEKVHQLKVSVNCASFDNAKLSDTRLDSANRATVQQSRVEPKTLYRNDNRRYESEGTHCQAVTVVVESPGCHDDDDMTPDEATERQSFKQLLQNFEAMTIPYMRRHRPETDVSVN